jgi:hypothetical protein
MAKKKNDISILNVPIDIPEGESGEWRVQRFVVNEAEADLHNMHCMLGFNLCGRGRLINPGTYTKLMRGGTLVMSDTPAERRDHFDCWRDAKGSVLINGLGLGVIAKALLLKPEVDFVTVVEISEDVVNLVGSHLMEQFPDKLAIIIADALEYKPPKGARYNYVWHDIWDNICADNLPTMRKLHRKWGRRTDAQGSWCRWQCEYHNRKG